MTMGASGEVNNFSSRSLTSQSCLIKSKLGYIKAKGFSGLCLRSLNFLTATESIPFTTN